MKKINEPERDYIESAKPEFDIGEKLKTNSGQNIQGGTISGFFSAK